MSEPKLAEKTFRAYTAEQGATYARNRPSYHAKLEQLIIDHHTSTGGQLGTLVDVGCGPGTAVRQFAPHFATAIGLDPSPGMISTARSLGGTSASSEPIRFEISTAEELGSNLTSPALPDGSVDLVIAATAAHWFEMSRFWPRAAALLRPGGTVAIWTGQPAGAHPSMPNAAAINAAVLEDWDRYFRPYTTRANLLSLDLYDDMALPWTLEPCVPEFDESTFLRKEWNRDGVAGDGDEFFADGQPAVDMETMEKLLGTMSPVTRWREAHPDAVGTEDDAVRLIRRRIEKLLHEAGVEEGKETIRFGVTGVLMMVKKSL